MESYTRFSCQRSCDNRIVRSGFSYLGVPEREKAGGSPACCAHMQTEGGVIELLMIPII